jgi:hypothetical protein
MLPEGSEGKAFDPPYQMQPVAGWSSPVARRAHNPKVASSNLAPATKERKSLRVARFLRDFLFSKPAFKHEPDWKQQHDPIPFRTIPKQGLRSGYLHSPALPKQVQFLESLGYEIEEFQCYCIVLRAAITRHILDNEDDARFRRAYEANRKDNAERIHRGRGNGPTLSTQTETTESHLLDAANPRAVNAAQGNQGSDDFIRVLDSMK